MIVMLDTSHDLDTAAAELGYPTEQLFTPLTRYRNRHTDKHFAIDNGAFSKFDRKAFESLLLREEPNRGKCRFVAVPDVVASAQRTSELFEYFYPLLLKWRLAYVAQDGQENVRIPWLQIAAIFIGGTTKFKESDCAIQIVKVAKAMNKWVHIGRVNTPDRLVAFEQLGADSVDGSGISRYTHMREKIGNRNGENRLFTVEEMICTQSA